MKPDSHDVLLGLSLVGVIALVLTGHLEASAALTFLGGLVLRSPLDRPAPAEQDGQPPQD